MIEKALMSHIEPAEFCRTRLGFHPDRHQSLVLDPNLRRGILNCKRRFPHNHHR